MGEVTSLFVRKLIAAAGPDVDQRALLASVGIDADLPADPKLMIADTAYYDLIERIASETDIIDLPLKTGATMRCDDYGALGLAWKAAPTLRGSLSRVERYARLWTSVVGYEVIPDPKGAWLVTLRAGQRRLGLRISIEATLASGVAISREVSPDPFAPIEVHLQHPAPRDTHLHERYFGCPVFFGSDRDAMLISKDALARQNRLGDEGITRFLLMHLDAELKQVSRDDTIRAHAQDAIARALSGGVPRIEEIASRLGLSPRTLQRRLSEEGLSFQALVVATRQELAEGLLRDPHYSLAEVAFLTGFSEQSSFTRAFKRWAGATPAHFRKSCP